MAWCYLNNASIAKWARSQSRPLSTTVAFKVQLQAQESNKTIDRYFNAAGTYEHCAPPICICYSGWEHVVLVVAAFPQTPLHLPFEPVAYDLHLVRSRHLHVQDKP